MSTFPNIAGGLVVSQRPYTNDSSFLHTTNDMESGPRYTHSWRVNPLRQFTLSYPAISATEAATLEAFFVSMAGKFGSFQFTDIDGTVYPTVRFDQDVFELTYVGPGQNSVTLKLAVIGS